MDKWINQKVALKCWLVFMLAFVIAGYAVETAILLGILGGVAAGFLSLWWQRKTIEATEAEKAEVKADAEKIIVAVKKVQERIKGQLKFSNRDDRNSRKSMRMGWFRIKDDRRPNNRKH